MAYVDVGTDEPQWVPDDTPGLVAGDRDGYSALVNPDTGAPETLQDRRWAEQEAERNRYLTSRAVNDPESLTESEILWLMAYGEFDQAHRAGFGIPINRPWHVDADAQMAKLGIDDRARQLAAEYAGELGDDFAWDESLFGINAQPNEPIQQRRSRHGFGGLFSSVVDYGIGMLPALAGAGLAVMAGLPPIGIGAAAGASGAAAQPDANFGDILKGAGIGGIGGGIASEIAPMFDDPLIGGGAAGAAVGGTTAALTGGDITDAALRGGLAGVAKAPLTSTPNQVPLTGDDDLYLAQTATEGVAPIGEGMLPVGLNFQEMMYTPETAAQIDALMAQQQPGPTIEEFAAQASPELQSTLGGMGLLGGAIPSLALSEPDSPSAPEAEPAPTLEEPTTVEKTPQEYVQLAAKAVDWYLKIFGEEGGPPPPVFAPPPRSEGQTDEEYETAVQEYAAEYIGLDVATEEGLTPGTPEYMQFILSEADRIIAAVFDDDPYGTPAADLQAAFEKLTRDEAQDLIRALYVRGVLGSRTYSQQVEDPFTGITEELRLASGESVIDAPVAATQKGYARFLEELSGARGADARHLLTGMLDRSPDLFDLQRRADIRKVQQRLTATERERDEFAPGLLGGNAPIEFWQQLMAEDPELAQRIGLGT